MAQPPIFITSAGVCCAVGMSLAAADCALRAGMDHFQESEFFTHAGDPVRVARLPDIERWGNERLAHWASLALSECLQEAADLELAHTPVLLLAAERERPHTHDDRYRDIFARLEQAMGVRFDPRSRIVAKGRAGLGPALQAARAWLAEGQARHVLIVGVDSYLDAATINHYLTARRLLVPGNSDGFIPGEAAAALALSATPLDACLAVCGVGVADEPGRPDGSVPSRARGLSQALRQALDEASAPPDTWTLRFSDQNGESFFAREASHAFTRVSLEGLNALDVITTADCVGEVGAAMGPMMLAWASRSLTAPDAPGQHAIAHLANDEGTRSVIALARHPRGEA
ncbi:hypothetical protein [Pseudomonas sp. RIT-PI-AD]|uniref:hypothetical protein n=1 Tax=Pseudomonas sp. RIT-PI-AD TaxID=3035294 RepID=UPI0021DAAA55|nr:hypothetical protein [Pseudomonas sp. RIT-PI-AD]